MAICPYCALEFYLENEDDLEKGDIVNCEECGATLEVARTSELELRLVSEDDDPEAEEETDDDSDDDDLDEDESYEDDFSDNGYYDVEEEEEEEEEE